MNSSIYIGFLRVLDGTLTTNPFEVDLTKSKTLKRGNTAMASQLVDEMAQASEQRAQFVRQESFMPPTIDEPDPDAPPSSHAHETASSSHHSPSSKRDKASKKKKKKKKKEEYEVEEDILEEDDDHICKVCTCRYIALH